MTSKVNADNTLGGVILTGDSSGILELQAGGVTKVTINSSGMTLADVLPVTSGGTGASSLSGITVGTATAATNLAAGSAGNVPYQTGAGATGFVTNGTAGQVLTSAGASAPTWSTLTVSGSGGATASGNVTLTSASSGAQSVTPTTYGQIVTLPDATTMTKAGMVFNIRNAGAYPLKLQNSAGTILGFIFPLTSVVVGLADNSTAAGVWTADNLEPVAVTANLYATGVTSFNATRVVVNLDANRQMILMGTSTNNLYAVVYDQSTQTFGTTTLVRSSGSVFTASLIATDKVLAVSTDGSTGLQAVVLSTSGTTITVNTAATKTLASTVTWYPPQDNIVTVGSTYIATYFSLSTNRALAFTVSGTTVTIGNEKVLNGTTGEYAQAFSISSTVVLIFTMTSGSLIYCDPYTVSGTTLTIGTSFSLGISGSATQYRLATVNSGSRWALFYGNSAGSLSVSLVSISGSTVSASTVVVLTSPFDFGMVSYGNMIVSGNKVIVVSRNTSNYAMFNVVTDTSGTATAGTQIVPNAQGSVTSDFSPMALAYSNKVVAMINNAGRWRSVTLDYSGASLVASQLSTNDSPMNPISTFIWNNQKGEQTLLGSTFAYGAPTSTAGYRCSVLSQNGFMALYYKQGKPVDATAVSAKDNELWYCNAGGTSYNLQRIECATI